MKIALAQIEVVPGRPDINTAAMLDAIGQARGDGARIVVFPEMAIPGYLLGDAWEQEAFLRDCEHHGRRIIAASEGLCVLFGNIAMDWHKRGADGRVRKYNACFVAVDGRLVGEDNFPYPFRIKTLHPNYREFDDSRHFTSLLHLAGELETPAAGLLQPVVFKLDGRRLRLGCILCEDGWHEDYTIDPAAEIRRHGELDAIVNLSSSPFTLGKNNKRNRVFSRQAAALQTATFYVNNVGLQNNGKTVYAFDGMSTVYDRGGRIIADCPAFEACLRVIDFDLDDGGQGAPAIEPEDDSGIDTVYRTLRYAVDGFCKQIGIDKVVIGVSGGIDSAVSSALYTEILGPDRILLASLPSRFNSATTQDLARSLAQNLGCWHTEVPIQASVDLTVEQLTGIALVNRQSGAEMHLEVTPAVHENIQARDRSARVLAALAAAFEGAFTCNANKSELTVGYTTLYGDHAGFLAALADLWKHQVYALGEYLNREVFASPVIPRGVFDIVPSAELSAAQAVDEGRGDPLVYPYHDYLFRAFMEWWRKATPEDLLRWYADGELEQRLGCEAGIVERLFPGPREFIEDLERWWKSYAGLGVAKRIQAPPVVAVSRRAYGFDHREAQNPVHFTEAYLRLKAKLLADTAD